MGIPTKSEAYSQLTEHLRLAQEAAAMLQMLNQAQGDAPAMVLGRGWFHVSEALKAMNHKVIQLATSSGRSLQ